MASLGKNRNILIIIALSLLAIIGIYLNRAYAHIYDLIGAAGLPALDAKGDYFISYAMPTEQNLTYVALGDSLSAGAGTAKPEEYLPYLLADKLAKSGYAINLKNYSVPGYQSADLLRDLLPEAIAAQPDVVTLLIGVNDIHNQVPISEFRKNYELILKRLSTETSAQIYIINLPLIGADTLMLPPYQAYFNHQTKAFNQVITKLAAEYKLTYIDLYTPTFNLFKRAGTHYSADLFHPSAAGYRIWADLIYDYFHN